MSKDINYDSQIKKLKNFIDIISTIKELAPLNADVKNAIDRRIVDIMIHAAEESLIQREESNKEEDDEMPIYEKLSPGDILIISKDKDCVLVAENKGGDVNIEKINIAENNLIKITEMVQDAQSSTKAA